MFIQNAHDLFKKLIFLTFEHCYYHISKVKDFNSKTHIQIGKTIIV
jgi:hypothetical protein